MSSSKVPFGIIEIFVTVPKNPTLPSAAAHWQSRRAINYITKGSYELVIHNGSRGTKYVILHAYPIISSYSAGGL